MELTTQHFCCFPVGGAKKWSHVRCQDQRCRREGWYRSDQDRCSGKQFEIHGNVYLCLVISDQTWMLFSSFQYFWNEVFQKKTQCEIFLYTSIDFYPDTEPSEALNEVERRSKLFKKELFLLCAGRMAGPGLLTNIPSVSWSWNQQKVFGRHKGVKWRQPPTQFACSCILISMSSLCRYKKQI